jgi:hypothetical protein
MKNKSLFVDAVIGGKGQTNLVASRNDVIGEGAATEPAKDWRVAAAAIFDFQVVKLAIVSQLDLKVQILYKDVYPGTVTNNKYRVLNGYLGNLPHYYRGVRSKLVFYNVPTTLT